MNLVGCCCHWLHWSFSTTIALVNDRHMEMPASVLVIPLHLPSIWICFYCNIEQAMI